MVFKLASFIIASYIKRTCCIVLNTTLHLLLIYYRTSLENMKSELISRKINTKNEQLLKSFLKIVFLSDRVKQLHSMNFLKLSKNEMLYKTLRQ